MKIKLLLLLVFCSDAAAMQPAAISNDETVLNDLKAIEVDYINRSEWFDTGPMLVTTAGNPICYWRDTHAALQNGDVETLYTISIKIKENAKCTELHALLIRILSASNKSKL